MRVQLQAKIGLGNKDFKLNGKIKIIKNNADKLFFRNGLGKKLSTLFNSPGASQLILFHRP